jgi:hypothetical protein
MMMEGDGPAWGDGGGAESARPVPAAGRAKLGAFVQGLRIGPHLDELWRLLSSRG